MSKNLDINKFRKVITECFPPLKYAVGYGSAFFKQKNYDYTKPPLLDLIFVVEDRKEWHSLNMKTNRNHYSGMSYLFGSSFIDLAQNFFSPIHYNPFIQLDEFYIKYGVITEDDFKRDLTSWEWLAIAGRLQKPTKQILGDDLYDEYVTRNLKSALAVSLLLNNKTGLKDKEIFFNLVSLSYIGDIRFTLKSENQDKIINIVEGQYQELKELYYPILKSKQFSSHIRMDESGFLFLDYNQNTRRFLIDLMPDHFGTEVVGANKNFKDSIFLRKDEQIELIKDSLSAVNSRVSREMIIYHLFTKSPIQNLKYGLAKIQKAFKK